jgi:LAO/AO transport system kinase
MATRGYLGGLARATGDVVALLEAAGKDLVLVETVGVGQDEVEVVRLAELVLVILTPDAGDDVQIFKAGIMEIADIFVLNKADSPDSGIMERRLNALLDSGGQRGVIPPLVMKTVATSGEGIEALWEEMQRSLRSQSPEEREQRQRRRRSRPLYTSRSCPAGEPGGVRWESRKWTTSRSRSKTSKTARHGGSLPWVCKQAGSKSSRKEAFVCAS